MSGLSRTKPAIALVINPYVAPAAANASEVLDAVPSVQVDGDGAAVGRHGRIELGFVEHRLRNVRLRERTCKCAQRSESIGAGFTAFHLKYWST